jgi:ATP-dependent DNA helicase RecQ
MLKVLDVDGAVRRARGGWLATGEPWTYDGARLRRVAEARSAEQKTMLEYASTGDCRMEFLRRCLDDPEAAPCGRCDNCAEPQFDAEVSAASIAAADAFLGHPGVVIAPKKMWPTGLSAVGVSLKGKIAAGEQIESGRAVGRLSDLGWGSRLRGLVSPESPDAPIPDDLAAAVVEILKDWAHGDDAWSQRPAAVVALSSRRHPDLISTLAGHIAKIGRLPLLGTVEVTASAESDGRGNSAQRVRVLHDAFTVPAQVANELPGLYGPVLLVDDLVDSGWTMTLAGRALRRAGAEGVLPLALAVAG